MPYEVLLHPNAAKFLDSLSKDISSRIKERLKELKENPFYHLEHYEGDDFYKLRIGDYRALVDVDMKNKIVFVQVLDHRSRIYKRKR